MEYSKSVQKKFIENSDCVFYREKQILPIYIRTQNGKICIPDKDFSLRNLDSLITAYTFRIALFGKATVTGVLTSVNDKSISVKCFREHVNIKLDTIKSINVIKDEAGDSITNNPIKSAEGDAVKDLVLVTSIINNAESIVACIPEAVRKNYPEDVKEAALKFYKENKSLFEEN